MSDIEYKSAQDFISNMDRGIFDARPGFSAELKKLTPEQLEEVARILLQRTSPGKKQSRSDWENPSMHS